MGMAMLSGGKTRFPRYLPWLGIGTGTLGVVGEVLRHAVPDFYWGYGILLCLWFLAAGTALIRLSRRPGPHPAEGDPGLWAL